VKLLTPARRVIAVIGLAALGAAGFSTAAHAAQDDIDPFKMGRLTIHKYEGLPTNLPNDGSQLDPNDLNFLTPRNDILFEVTQVGIGNGSVCEPVDMTRPGIWRELKDKLTPPYDEPNGYPADGQLCKTMNVMGAHTDVQGTVTFGHLPLSLYWVVEKLDGGVSVDPVDPFFVTLPYPNNELGEWNYDVHVYPKNQSLDEPFKYITERPSDLTVGAKVTWDIEVGLPKLAGSSQINDVMITDWLPSGLTYTSSAIYLDEQLMWHSGNDTNDDGVEVLGYDPDKSWVLSGPAADKLNQHPGGVLRLELVTTVTSTEIGEIENGRVVVKINNAVRETGSAFTYWGQLEVRKVDSSEATPKPLAGAEFLVFEKPEAAECSAQALENEAPVAQGISAADGMVEWEVSVGGAPSVTKTLGLWVANSNYQLFAPTKDYCLQETKAPNGYEKIDELRLITITGNGSNTKLVLDVPNSPIVGPNLPLTGAGGTVALSITGLAFVGLGALVVVAHRRSLKAQRSS